MRLAVLPWSLQPALMHRLGLPRHDGSGDHIELIRAFVVGLSDATQDSEEIVLILLLGFLPNGTGLVARHICLHLNVDKLGPRDVAAQDVGVGCIAERDNGVIAPTAQLSCNEELAGVTSECLVGSHWHSVCQQFWLALQVWPTRTSTFKSRQKRLFVRGGCTPSSSRSCVTSSPTRRLCTRNG